MADTLYRVRTPKNPHYAGRQHSVQFSRGEAVTTKERAEYLRDRYGYEIERVGAKAAGEIRAAVDGHRLGSVPPASAPPEEGKAAQLVDPETKEAGDGTPVVVEGNPVDTEPDALTRVKGIGPSTAKLVRECLIETLDALANVDAETLASALAKKGAVGIGEDVVKGWKAQAQAIVEGAADESDDNEDA